MLHIFLIMLRIKSSVEIIIPVNPGNSLIHKSHISNNTLLQRDVVIVKQIHLYRDSNIILFALSIAIVSNDARYMRVVASESCPIPSLITEMGTFLLFAILAQA